MRSIIKNNRAQVWVETVIYTLIGLSVIGILLAVATPKVNDMKDRLRINEAIDILNQMDAKISEVQSAPSNQRVYNLVINKGKVIINQTSDEITWLIESNYEYSEPGIVTYVGDLKILTEGDDFYKIYITRSYGVDLTIDNGEVLELESASIPYELIIKSVASSGNDVQVDISVN